MEYVPQICSVLALVLAYFAISREGRADLKASLRKAFGILRKGVVAVGVVIAVFAPPLIVVDSYTEIQQFKNSAAPITRPEIINLLFLSFNLGMYSLYSVTVFVVIYQLGMEKLRGKPKPKETAETENPSEEGLSG